MQAAIVHLRGAIMIIRALPALHRPTPPRMRRCRFVRAHTVAGLTIAVVRQPANAEIVTELNGYAHKYRLHTVSSQISDRKSFGWGPSVSVRVNIGGRRS